MSKSIVATIAGLVLPAVIDAMANRGRGVDHVEAVDISQEVAKEIAPIVVNATNNEPWYRSRVYQGLIIAVIGFIASRFGGTGYDHVDIYNGLALSADAAGSGLEGVGLLWAAWGRMRTNIKLGA